MANKKNNSRNQERVLFILMGLIIVGLAASGYFLFVKKVLPGLSAAAGTAEKPASVQAQPVVQQERAEVYIPDSEAGTIKVYFPKKGKDAMAFEERRVRKNAMLVAQARQIVEMSLEQPTNGSLYRIIPENTKLRGLFFNSGTFMIDLSREFEAVFNLGAAEQALAVYSIVNSLTELDPRANVKFLINGNEPDGERSHIDMSSDMTRLESLIEG